MEEVRYAQQPGPDLLLTLLNHADAYDYAREDFEFFRDISDLQWAVIESKPDVYFLGFGWKSDFGTVVLWGVSMQVKGLNNSFHIVRHRVSQGLYWSKPVHYRETWPVTQETYARFIQTACYLNPNVAVSNIEVL